MRNMPTESCTAYLALHSNVESFYQHLLYVKKDTAMFC